MTNPFDIREALEENWNGKHLLIAPLTGRKALTGAYRFSKYIGPSLGKLAKDAKTGKSLKDIELDFDAIIEAFFDNCSEKEFESFASMMLDTAKIDGQTLSLESNHFLGHPERILELLFKIVKYQYAGFFSGFQNNAFLQKMTHLVK